jgi:hypothetical protein
VRPGEQLINNELVEPAGYQPMRKRTVVPLCSLMNTHARSLGLHILHATSCGWMYSLLSKANPAVRPFSMEHSARASCLPQSAMIWAPIPYVRSSCDRRLSPLAATAGSAAADQPQQAFVRTRPPRTRAMPLPLRKFQQGRCAGSPKSCVYRQYHSGVLHVHPDQVGFSAAA